MPLSKQQPSGYAHYVAIGHIVAYPDNDTRYVVFHVETSEEGHLTVGMIRIGDSRNWRLPPLRAVEYLHGDDAVNQLVLLGDTVHVKP